MGFFHETNFHTQIHVEHVSLTINWWINYSPFCADKNLKCPSFFSDYAEHSTHIFTCSNRMSLSNWNEFEVASVSCHSVCVCCECCRFLICNNIKMALMAKLQKANETNKLNIEFNKYIIASIRMVKKNVNEKSLVDPICHFLNFFFCQACFQTVFIRHTCFTIVQIVLF